MPNGEKISTIGFGVGNLEYVSDNEIERIFSVGIERGMNFLDTCMSTDTAAYPIAKVIKGKREKLLLQNHFCISYPKGGYERVRDLNGVKDAFTKELKKYGTDYTDIGMIHFIDTDNDLDTVLNNRLIEYAYQLRKEGIIRYVGFSSHTPATCFKVLKAAKFDVMMLGINAAYDFEPSKSGLILSAERTAFYQECQKQGVAITVMKPYNAGQLLNAKTSPFKCAMTIPQCIQYALDRPAVVSCLVGAETLSELEATLNYYNSTAEERDYSFIGNLQRKDMTGVCVYCNHCLPCPAGIDIGTVNKYIDLIKTGDKIAADHYRKLSKHAGDCIGCSNCERSCPFGVNVRERMEEAKKLI